MKRLFNQTVILLVFCVAASITAMATTTTKMVNFNSDVTVNGTSVKAGTYKATFDDTTGVFTLLNGKTVVAKVMARLESHRDASGSEVETKANGMSSALVSVDLNRSNRVVIVNDGEGNVMTTP